MTGLVGRELSLSYDELRSLEQVEIARGFHCVTGWSVRAVRWRGVRIARLAEMAGVRPEARWVKFVSLDGYDTSVPLEDALVEEGLSPEGERLEGRAHSLTSPDRAI